MECECVSLFTVISNLSNFHTKVHMGSYNFGVDNIHNLDIDKHFKHRSTNLIKFFAHNCIQLQRIPNKTTH